jgi:predicted peptidase
MNISRTCRLVVTLVVLYGVVGCTRQAKKPHLLETKMLASVFSLPTARYPLPYRLFVPSSLRAKAPLIVWLHATTGRGTDNLAQLGPEVEVLVSDRVQTIEPTFVLAPQCPAHDKWANVRAIFPLHPYDLASTPESSASWQTVALIEKLVGNYPIDANRIYVMGFSMGGSGTWDMLMRHRGLFAAGVPMSGVADISRANLLSSTPIWSFHGELDPVSPIENGRRIFAALQKLGAATVRFSELKGVDHGCVGPALDEPNLFPWLLAQHRLP